MTTILLVAATASFGFLMLPPLLRIVRSPREVRALIDTGSEFAEL